MLVKRCLKRVKYVLVSAGAFGLWGCGEDRGGNVHSAATDFEWTHYAADAGGSKYSPLAQIDRENVSDLVVAWTARAGDFPAEVFDPYGHRAGWRRADGGLVAARPGASCGSCHDMELRFETTPLMRGGLLHLSTPRSRALALDPATGAARWAFDPQIELDRRYAEDLTSRGVAVWSDPGGRPGEACSNRVFLATVDARLIALDAAAGTPCSGFGDGGAIRLAAGVALDEAAVGPSEYSVTSPAAVVSDLVVIGSAVSNNQSPVPASGVVRAFDARTGALRWSFDPIPRSATDPAWSSWTPEAARTTGGANVWSIISADAERDLVFLPTGSAAPDFYGGGRPGRNEHANSVVALRASTGELVWSFQVVHHDLWNYDVAAQPMLIDLRRDGAEIPAVVVGTKTGMIFVLDRLTGEPLFPMEQRRVPPSDVPGEQAWPVQPFAIDPPSLHGTMLSPDSAFGMNTADRAYCRAWMARLRNHGMFTPPSFQGTLVWPGFWGGINWNGMAWDPERQLLLTTLIRMAMVVQLHHRGDVPAVLRNRRPGMQFLAQEGAPYAATRIPLVASSGMPCSPPPWGLLVAVDLANGSIRWQRPLGTVPWLREVPGSEAWGSVGFGGPLVSAGGLVFVGASQDDRFRAFDIETGALLWEHQLPAGGQASPMTYLHQGRQYVVIAAGGRAGIGSPGDWIVAFALPRADGRGGRPR